jgi:beta-1,4-mannosyltransferase
MFGCGLPVCAASYDCIQELVSDGDNGLLFTGPKQLAAQLAELLAGLPSRPSKR